MEKEIKQLEGKTIKTIEFPVFLKFKADEGSTYEPECNNDNILITFTDGTVLKLASWDYEGYSSGIYKEIVSPPYHQIT